MSLEAVEYHIYNSEGGYERVATVPGTTFDIDANLEAFDGEAFVTAVKSRPGSYLVVCYRHLEANAEHALPMFLYSVVVELAQSAKVTAVGHR